MTTLIINGKTYTGDGEKSLLRFLRDDLHITSVKDGCSEGACGTCTVLVNGKKVKACVQKLRLFEGKEVLTVEGLSEYEKSVYEYCFGAAGAVQCGFCIPGMVLSTKSLLDKNPNPNDEEIREGISGNLCRCTGYNKMVDATKKAIKYIEEEER